MNTPNKISFDWERRVLHHLMLNSLLIKDISLFYGKMGIAIVFFHYSRYKNEDIYNEFAEQLIEELWQEVHTELPLNFDTGLCGIVWGIEYLIQNQFVEGNSDEICEELDRHIMSRDLRRILTDDFIDNDLTGFLHYIGIRISGSVYKDKPIPFDKLYIEDLCHLLEETESRKNILNSSRVLIRKILGYFLRAETFHYDLSISKFIESNSLEIDISSTALGLKEGLAGILYKEISYHQ